jgi:hypothetical protein
MITFKKSVLKRMPEDDVKTLYLKTLGPLPSLSFNYDEDKLMKAIIAALVDGEKISDDIDFDDTDVPDDAVE